MTNINLFRDRPVAVIGAGVMGVGIVQVALLAGHPVHLFDLREGAAAAAAAQLLVTLGKLADKGKLTPEDVAAARGRVRAAATSSSVSLPLSASLASVAISCSAAAAAAPSRTSNRCTG